jgi:hypothetical protein
MTKQNLKYLELLIQDSRRTKCSSNYPEVKKQLLKLQEDFNNSSILQLIQQSVTIFFSAVHIYQTFNEKLYLGDIEKHYTEFKNIIGSIR